MISEKWKKSAVVFPFVHKVENLQQPQCNALDLQKGEVMLLLMGHHWPLFQKEYA